MREEKKERREKREERWMKDEKPLINARGLIRECDGQHFVVVVVEGEERGGRGGGVVFPFVSRAKLVESSSAVSLIFFQLLLFLSDTSLPLRPHPLLPVVVVPSRDVG
jgi:hypothetical protein